MCRIGLWGDGQNTAEAVNPLALKYSALPKFGNDVCVVHPGLVLRGDRPSSRSRAGDAVDAAASARWGAGRAGSPCEPETCVGTNEAVQFVAPTFLQRVCTLLQDPVAGECAYGKTVWSWPS